MMNNIKWFGHASFKFSGEKIIYIDPVDVSDSEKADIILVSHSHYDHFSLKDIAKLTDSNTNILITPDAQSKLRDIQGKVTLIEPNKKYNVQGVLIETFPAYNLNKPFHPKDNDWVGFIFTLNGNRILYTGDSDLTPELQRLKADIALVPVSGKYVMNPREAADLVNLIKPKLAIPYHYGSIVGSMEDVQKFKSLTPIPINVLRKE